MQEQKSGFQVFSLLLVLLMQSSWNGCFYPEIRKLHETAVKSDPSCSAKAGNQPWRPVVEDYHWEKKNHIPVVCLSAITTPRGKMSSTTLIFQFVSASHDRTKLHPEFQLQENLRKVILSLLTLMELRKAYKMIGRGAEQKQW